MTRYTVGYLNTCSVELPAGGVHAMNNITKWCIALSTNTGVLENH